MRTLEILAGRLFDGVAFSEGPRLIRVEGEKIREVRPYLNEPLSPGAIDARAQLLSPGLINGHVHIARGGGFEPDEGPAPGQVLRSFADALAAGVTTVGDMGCPAPMISSLRRCVRGEPLSGP